MHYSGENVPIPLSREYEKRLLEKIETIVKMDDMESIFLFLHSKSDTNTSIIDEEEVQSETYRLKSKRHHQNLMRQPGLNGTCWKWLEHSNSGCEQQFSIHPQKGCGKN